VVLAQQIPRAGHGLVGSEIWRTYLWRALGEVLDFREIPRISIASEKKLNGSAGFLKLARSNEVRAGGS